MAKQCNIQYIALNDNWRKEQKLQWFTENPLKKIHFKHIQPDKNNNWINIADNDFETLLPLCSKDVKSGKSKKALFELFTNGVVTNRDEWVYDFDLLILQRKMNFFSETYNENIVSAKYSDAIKWSRDLKNEAKRKRESSFNNNKITDVLYRPFVKQNYYSEFIFSDMLTNNHYDIFGKEFDKKNLVIGFLSIASNHQLSCLVSDKLIDLCLLKQGNGGTQMLSLYRYDVLGNQIENITDWGLQQFTKQYGKKGVTKEAIFHYVYAVLHNPAYRKKYELNLKREFPRIPFYNNFTQWSNWGKQLMDLHINYEKVKPFVLAIKNQNPLVSRAKSNTSKKALQQLAKILQELPSMVAEEPAPYGKAVKTKLKANKVTGEIEIDEITTLTGIPPQAWEYKLGNRSALEWVLDQYKESKPKDPTIAEKFNTYKFADYKDQVIDLLKKVCTVSVETMKIVGEMEKE